MFGLFSQTKMAIVRIAINRLINMMLKKKLNAIGSGIFYTLLETEITEADIELFMLSFDCDRERAIELLIQEAQAKIQYEIYLNSPIDPRD